MTAVASSRKERSVRCMVRKSLKFPLVGACCYFAEDCSRAPFFFSCGEANMRSM